MRSEATRDLLTLVQWLSPAFPVGGYAYSHGLEAAVAAGDVTDAASFRAWLGPVVCEGSGWCDAVLLSLTHRGAAEAAELSDLAVALAPGAERAAETRALGRAFCAATDALTGAAGPPRAMPVALGERARALDLSTATVAALYLQAFAGNLATIAARIVPLGQTAAQTGLAGLGPAIAAMAERAAAAELADLASATPGADLASLRHETGEVRLFAS